MWHIVTRSNRNQHLVPYTHRYTSESQATVRHHFILKNPEFLPELLWRMAVSCMLQWNPFRRSVSRTAPPSGYYLLLYFPLLSLYLSVFPAPTQEAMTGFSDHSHYCYLRNNPDCWRCQRHIEKEKSVKFRFDIGQKVLISFLWQKRWQ